MSDLFTGVKLEPGRRPFQQTWRKHKLNELPVGRPGQVGEIASAAVLLASEQGAYDVGVTMKPNGDVML